LERFSTQRPHCNSLLLELRRSDSHSLVQVTVCLLSSSRHRSDGVPVCPSFIRTSTQKVSLELERSILTNFRYHFLSSCSLVRSFKNRSWSKFDQFCWSMLLFCPLWPLFDHYLSSVTIIWPLFDHYLTIIYPLTIIWPLFDHYLSSVTILWPLFDYYLTTI
jgi:hypothetical protein